MTSPVPLRFSVIFNSPIFKFIATTMLTSVLLDDSVHTIEQGYIGVYSRGGAIMDRVESPGFNFKWPLIDQVTPIQHTLQTDNVANVPCGTSGGVKIIFPRIEVVNMLPPAFVLPTIKDFTKDYERTLIVAPLHALVNDWCSARKLEEVYITEYSALDDYLKRGLEEYIDRLARGLIIVAVRVTKPVIPSEINANYEELEKQKTALAVEQARQKVVLQQAETDRKKAEIAAQQEADVAKINNAAAIALQKAEQQISAIRDATKMATDKAVAEAELYTIQRKAEGHKQLLTKEYLELERYRSSMTNAKLHYFGPNVPAYIGSLGDAPKHFS